MQIWVIMESRGQEVKVSVRFPLNQGIMGLSLAEIHTSKISHIKIVPVSPRSRHEGNSC